MAVSRVVLATTPLMHDEVRSVDMSVHARSSRCAAIPQSWVSRHTEDFTRAAAWNTSEIFGPTGTRSRLRTRAPAIKQQGKHPGAHRDARAEVRPSVLRTRTSVSEDRVPQARRHLIKYPNKPHSNIRHDRKTKERPRLRTVRRLGEKRRERVERCSETQEMVAWEARQDRVWTACKPQRETQGSVRYRSRSCVQESRRIPFRLRGLGAKRRGFANPHLREVGLPQHKKTNCHGQEQILGEHLNLSCVD